MKRLLTKLEAMLTAAAFAEEGDADTARQLVAEGDGRPPLRPTAAAPDQTRRSRQAGAEPLPLPKRARRA